MAYMGGTICVYRYLVEKHERKRPLGIPRRRWEGNIRIDPQGIRVRSVNWKDMAQDKDKCLALVKVAMKYWLP